MSKPRKYATTTEATIRTLVAQGLTNGQIAEKLNLSPTYMVHDERGNVWPPGFRSELCDHDSPHTMLNHKAKTAAAALAKATAAREAGKGWANGNMPHMNKPLIQGAKKASA